MRTLSHPKPRNKARKHPVSCEREGGQCARVGNGLWGKEDFQGCKALPHSLGLQGPADARREGVGIACPAGEECSD